MRRALPSLSFLACLALCALPAHAHAHAQGCGNSIFSEGDSTMLLFRNCGEPTLEEHFVNRTPVEAYDQMRGEYYIANNEQPYDVWT